MTDQNESSDASIDELRQRYRLEQQKRLRPEGMAQWRELKDEFEDLDRDPFVEPGFTRDPVVEETTVVIVGGGFAGMLTAIDLDKHGITTSGSSRRRETSAAPGTGTGTRAACATWSRTRTCRSSRRPGSCRPSATPAPRRSSSTPSLLARTFDLYPHALFQTDVTGAEWDEEARRWQVTTSRGDRLSSRFMVLAGGILHKAKLPGIPGIEDFEGKAFHTSRWDYSYTGGSPTEPMDRLGRQAGRHHRHRRHRRAGGAPDRPGGQGALRLPAHPGGGGRPQPAAHRRRVVPEPRARLAEGADRQLHPGGDRRPARGGPGE